MADQVVETDSPAFNYPEQVALRARLAAACRIAVRRNLEYLFVCHWPKVEEFASPAG